MYCEVCFLDKTKREGYNSAFGPDIRSGSWCDELKETIEEIHKIHQKQLNNADLKSKLKHPSDDERIVKYFKRKAKWKLFFKNRLTRE